MAAGGMGEKPCKGKGTVLHCFPCHRIATDVLAPWARYHCLVDWIQAVHCRLLTPALGYSQTRSICKPPEGPESGA